MPLALRERGGKYAKRKDILRGVFFSPIFRVMYIFLDSATGKETMCHSLSTSITHRSITPWSKKHKSISLVFHAAFKSLLGYKNVLIFLTF